MHATLTWWTRITRMIWKVFDVRINDSRSCYRLIKCGTGHSLDKSPISYDFTNPIRQFIMSLSYCVLRILLRSRPEIAIIKIRLRVLAKHSLQLKFVILLNTLHKHFAIQFIWIRLSQNSKKSLSHSVFD